jgi:hypothetical protein
VNIVFEQSPGTPNWEDRSYPEPGSTSIGAVVANAGVLIRNDMFLLQKSFSEIILLP